jgi:predicted DNA-binding transcriptional regulator AlpA
MSRTTIASATRPYLTLREAADFLRVTREYFLQGLKQRPGFPQPIRLSPGPNGKTLYRTAELIAWVEAQGAAQHQVKPKKGAAK